MAHSKTAVTSVSEPQVLGGHAAVPAQGFLRGPRSSRRQQRPLHPF